jgi:AcrR family transcriptional regulator
MAAPTRTPRHTWIEQGLKALAAGGPDAVRVEPLAKALGVTKGGFYWHFEDRGALLDAVLDTWERTYVDDVIENVEHHGGDDRAKLRRLFSLASSAGSGLIHIELAIRDWARRDGSVATRLSRVDNRRMDYMRSLFRGFCGDEDDVEVRCTLVFALFVGSHFIAADHAGRTRRSVLELSLESLLTPAGCDPPRPARGRAG